MTFHVVTIADMVRAQAMLLDYMGIERLRPVMGGSMGGMQVLSWTSLFPDRVEAAIVIASTARIRAQNIAFHEGGRSDEKTSELPSLMRISYAVLCLRKKKKE